MKRANFLWTAFPILLCTACFLSCLPVPAAAHLDKGSTPDGVAEVEYLILLEFEPGNIEVRNLLGMVYYRLKKIDKAAEQFAAVLDIAPEDFDALDGMGLVLAAGKNYVPAIDHFSRAIARRPADALVYFHLGQVYEETGKIPAAADAYQDALQRLAKDEKSAQQDKKIATVEAALTRVRGKQQDNQGP